VVVRLLKKKGFLRSVFELHSDFCFSLGRKATKEPNKLSFFDAKEPTFYRLKKCVTSVVVLGISVLFILFFSLPLKQVTEQV